MSKEKKYASSRKWALENPEKVKKYGRDFYARNKERRQAYSREYHRKHREERCAYSREYYRRKKSEDPDYVKKKNANKKRLSYESLVGHCRKTLNEYLYSSLRRDKETSSERIDVYFREYPFEDFAEFAIRRRLRQLGVYSGKAIYDDCYEAGTMAYIYSVHRCGASGYDHFLPYLHKMIRIYILCAMIIYNDSKNLCRINGLKEVRLDSGENTNRF